MSNTGSQAQEEMLAFMRPGIGDQRSSVVFLGSGILICLVIIFTLGMHSYDGEKLILPCGALVAIFAFTLVQAVVKIIRKRQAFDAWFQGLTAREQDSMTADFTGAVELQCTPLRLGREWLFLQGGTRRNSKEHWAIPLQDITGVMPDKEEEGPGWDKTIHFILRVRLGDKSWPTLWEYSSWKKANMAVNELKQALDQVLGADKVELTQYAVRPY